jgi:hypothetical protein
MIEKHGVDIRFKTKYWKAAQPGDPLYAKIFDTSAIRQGNDEHRGSPGPQVGTDIVFVNS